MSFPTSSLCHIVKTPALNKLKYIRLHFSHSALDIISLISPEICVLSFFFKPFYTLPVETMSAMSSLSVIPNSCIWLHKAFINDTDVIAYIISNCGKISCIFQGVTVQIIDWDWTTIKSKTILLHFYLYNDCVQCSGCCIWSKIIQYCQWQNPWWCIQIACFVQAALLNPELESHSLFGSFDLKTDDGGSSLTNVAQCCSRWFTHAAHRLFA